MTASNNTRQFQTRAYSPSPATTSRRNFSRPAVTPSPEAEDGGPRSLVASLCSSPSSISSRERIQEQARVPAKLTISTGAHSSPLNGIFSSTVYQPYSPATTPSQVHQRDEERNPSDIEGRGRSFGRTTPTEKRRSSSSAYSSATAPVQGHSSIPHLSAQSYSSTALPLRQLEQRRRPERLDIKPAKVLQQAETAKYFDSNSDIEDSVSPLLPSPRRRNDNGNSFGRRYSPDISPELGSNEFPESPDFDCSKRTTAPLDISFTDFSMPPPVMGTKNHLHSRAISAPQSPELQKLPAYLGKIQPVQRDLDYETPSSPDEMNNFSAPILQKPSVGRKVSKKFRTLVGAGGRPSTGTGGRPSTGTVATTTISSSNIRQLHLVSKAALGKHAISNPISIPKDKQTVDPEIQDITTRFDIERGIRPVQGTIIEGGFEAAHDWNYSHSAASSASNLSSHRSADNAHMGTESELSSGSPGLSSHRSSTRSSQRNATLDSPVTPADDGHSFSALRGHDTMKSDITVTPKDYQTPTIVTKHSEEVPVFLDTTGEANGSVPSFTHEPPTPEPHKTTFPGRVHSTSPESKHFFDNRKPLRESAESYGYSPRPSPTISSPPTSVATSPLSPISPMQHGRSPTARNPPFGYGLMLRSATMSSKSGGVPLKALKPTPSTAGSLQSRSPTRAHTIDLPSKEKRYNNGNEARTPVSPYIRTGSAFSFVHDDAPMIRPEDNISQAGPSASRSGSPAPQSGSPVASRPGSPPRAVSPTPFDVDRSLPRQSSLRHATSQSNFRASRAQNDRVAALSRIDTETPARPSTGTPGRTPLRVDTDLVPPASAPATGYFSAVEGPTNSSDLLQRPLTSQGLQPEPIKRNKSVGDGLRRAFSRRAPKGHAHSMPSTPPPTVEESESEVTGPLGCGPSSETSMARWNTAIRAAAVNSALQHNAAPRTNLESAPSGIKAQLLTAEDRSEMRHAPGTLFIRTCKENAHGISDSKEHRMKPRKGGPLQRCAFCQKGPFANMWICSDEEISGRPNDGSSGAAVSRCALAVCRMCCNEKVKEGSAEIF